jgi:hypothetical protein
VSLAIRSLQLRLTTSKFFKHLNFLLVSFHADIIFKYFSNVSFSFTVHNFCLVVRVPGYRSRSPGFDARRYQILWEVVGLERGPLSLVSTIQKLLKRKSSGSGLEIRHYGRRYPSRWPRGILCPQKLALTSPTSGSSSVGIVLSGTQAAEFFSLLHFVSCPLFVVITVLFDTIYTGWFTKFYPHLGREFLR